MVAQVSDAIDVDHDGATSYTEFLAAVLEMQGKLVDDLLRHAFSVFDVDRDGRITLDELRAILSGDGPLVAVLPDGQRVEDIIRAIDTSHDGAISFGEFRAYFQGSGEAGPLPSDLGHLVTDGEDLATAFCTLAVQLGRPAGELAAFAERLAERHWLTTVGDLRELQEADWPRLELPLKLELKLRSYIGSRPLTPGAALSPRSSGGLPAGG